jgi:hypothetical protein
VSKLPLERTDAPGSYRRGARYVVVSATQLVAILEKGVIALRCPSIVGCRYATLRAVGHARSEAGES